MSMIPVQTQVIQFSSTDGSLELNVPLQQESVWLSLSQMADLFERDKSVISRHIKKVFEEEEWKSDQAVAFSATVQKEDQVVAFFATTGSDGKIYQVEHFNLDVILSVGYRVNSKRGVEFRRWSNRILKDYLFKGYALNQRHFLQKGFEEVHQSLELLKRAFDQIETVDIQKSSLEIIQAYAKSWSLLLAYDENRLEGFHQPQDIKPLSISFLTTGKAYSVSVSLLTNEALVALALLTAQSDPKDKDLMVKLIMQVIPDQNKGTYFSG